MYSTMAMTVDVWRLSSFPNQETFKAQLVLNPLSYDLFYASVWIPLLQFIWTKKIMMNEIMVPFIIVK